MEARAARFEFAAQLAEVVDRAVEGDADLRVRRKHRLPARLAQIKDRQAAMTEHARRPRFESCAVGAAPRKRVHHARDNFSRTALICKSCDACDATHNLVLSLDYLLDSNCLLTYRNRQTFIGRRCARARVVNKDSLPEFEHEERPERRRMVAPPAFVFA